MRPLIYALTGDVSKTIITRIQQLPFCGVYEKIDVGDMRFLLELIDERKKEFIQKKYKRMQSVVSSREQVGLLQQVADVGIQS